MSIPAPKKKPNSPRPNVAPAAQHPAHAQLPPAVEPPLEVGKITLRRGSVINIAGAPFRLIGMIPKDETIFLKKMSKEEFDQFIQEQAERAANKK